ncbi:hypothetical protein J3A83DRAFT_4210432 [Scleroderma citrinum]
MYIPQDATGGMGHRAFKIMFAIPVLGVIAIRVFEIFTMSQSIVLTVCLVVISMMPGEILSAAMYFDRVARNWLFKSRLTYRSGFNPSLIPRVSPCTPS